MGWIGATTTRLDLLHDGYLRRRPRWVFRPISSRISRRLYRQTSQDVFPCNVRFARALPEGSPFEPREALAGKDAGTLAREVLAMDVEGYRAAFRGSATTRAKLPAMKRNAAVVHGNVGTVAAVPVLEQAHEDEEPLVREHAAWALLRLRAHDSVAW